MALQRPTLPTPAAKNMSLTPRIHHGLRNICSLRGCQGQFPVSVIGKVPETVPTPWRIAGPRDTPTAAALRAPFRDAVIAGKQIHARPVF